MKHAIDWSVHEIQSSYRIHSAIFVLRRDWMIDTMEKEPMDAQDDDSSSGRITIEVVETVI